MVNEDEPDHGAPPPADGRLLPERLITLEPMVAQPGAEGYNRFVNQGRADLVAGNVLRDSAEHRP